MLKKISLFMLCGLILLGVCGCEHEESLPSDSVNDIPPNEVEQTPEIRDPFIVSDEKGKADDDYSYNITGIIKNTTDVLFTYAEINYVIYDKDGASLNTCFANTDYLEPNGTWKYRVHCPMPGGNAKSVTTFKMINYEYNW